MYLTKKVIALFTAGLHISHKILAYSEIFDIKHA